MNPATLTKEQIGEIVRRHKERTAREAVLTRNIGRDWTREARLRWRLYNAEHGFNAGFDSVRREA